MPTPQDSASSEASRQASRAFFIPENIDNNLITSSSGVSAHVGPLYSPNFQPIFHPDLPHPSTGNSIFDSNVQTHDYSVTHCIGQTDFGSNSPYSPRDYPSAMSNSTSADIWRPVGEQPTLQDHFINLQGPCQCHHCWPRGLDTSGATCQARRAEAFTTTGSDSKAASNLAKPPPPEPGRPEPQAQKPRNEDDM